MSLGCQLSWSKLHHLRRPTRAEGCSMSGRLWRSRRSKRSGVQIRRAEKATKPRFELEDPFRDENSQILHRLQSLLMNISLSGHTEATSHPLAPSAHFLPQKLRGEPTNKNLYQVGRMRLRLPELQAEKQEASQGRIGKSLPGWWNEATTSKSYRWETS